MPDPLDPLLDSAAPGGPDADADVDPAVLPGADRPHWVVPTLAIVFGSLIAGLVIFGQPDDRDEVADGPAAASASSVGPDSGVDEAVEASQTSAPEAAPGGDTSEPTDGGSGEDAALASDDLVVDPIADAAADAAEDAIVPDRAGAEVELPPVGTIRVGADEFVLLRSCVGLQPLAPNDTATSVSAHVFSPDGDREQVVERWFTAGGIDGVRVDGIGGDGLRQVSVVDVDADGAFAATLERPDGGSVDVVVNPLPSELQDCGQVVVTNEPGQFAFPYTRAVMSACVEGDPSADGRIVAILTEGGRMIAAGNGDGTHTLTLRTPENLTSPRLDASGENGALFVDGDRFGFSGLVVDGDTSLDLTFDVDTAGARRCTDDDA